MFLKDVKCRSTLLFTSFFETSATVRSVKRQGQDVQMVEDPEGAMGAFFSFVFKLLYLQVVSIANSLILDANIFISGRQESVHTGFFRQIVANVKKMDCRNSRCCHDV